MDQEQQILVPNTKEREKILGQLSERENQPVGYISACLCACICGACTACLCSCEVVPSSKQSIKED